MWLTTATVIMWGLDWRLTSLLENHHSSGLMQQRCRKCPNHGQKPFNTLFSSLKEETMLQMCENASNSWAKVAICTCPHPEKHCIISCRLLLSPPCGVSATNRMNCLHVALKWHHRHSSFVVRTVIWIIETTEMLIVIDVVCEGGKSLETPSNVIQLLSLICCTPLGQVIEGVDFRSWVVHHSLERHCGWRHFIVATFFCSIGSQQLIPKYILSCYQLQNDAGGLIRIRLSVHLFNIHRRSFWEFRACIQAVAMLGDMVWEVVQEMHLNRVEMRFIDKMLCIVWHDMRVIYINPNTRCS